MRNILEQLLALPEGALDRSAGDGPEPEPLTVAAVARRLRMDPRTVRRRAVEGCFPNAWRTGPGRNAHWLIPQSDVVRFAMVNREYEDGQDGQDGAEEPTEGGGSSP